MIGKDNDLTGRTDIARGQQMTREPSHGLPPSGRRSPLLTKLHHFLPAQCCSHVPSTPSIPAPRLCKPRRTSKEQDPASPSIPAPSRLSDHRARPERAAPACYTHLPDLYLSARAMPTNGLRPECCLV